MMIFVNHICIIVFPIQKVKKKFFFDKMPFFGPHLVLKVANMQKNKKMKNFVPCVFFFKYDQKNLKYLK